MPVQAGPATVESGQTPDRDLVGLPAGLRDRQPGSRLEDRHPDRRSLRRLLQPGHQRHGARTRRPPGSGRSTCTRSPARTCGSQGAARPIELASLVKNGTVDKTAYAALPAAPKGNVTFPTLAQLTAAQTLVTQNWATATGG